MLVGRTLIASFHFSSGFVVENFVEFFRESKEEIQIYPLAKICSFLIDKANLY